MMSFDLWFGSTSSRISTALVLLVLFHNPSLRSHKAPGTSNTLCKYSVRDVAFVSVHGKTWQLNLIKPVDAEPDLLQNWNHILKRDLARSNVGYLWLEHDSEQAAKLIEQTGVQSTRPNHPTLVLTGSKSSMFRFQPRESDPESSLNQLLSSPVRDEILKRTVDSLCVFVLIESGQQSLDQQAWNTIEAAQERTQQQLWTMEKPTSQGPALVRVSSDNLDDEFVLLESLGVDRSQLPAVAVLFGQARRLGNPMTGEEITIESLVGRASICGQDCECSLDREWLYGSQAIHRWSKALEAAAESDLSFDPHSALVVAEVAQILQKNRRSDDASISTNPVDLGGGLRVFDLDQLDHDKPSTSSDHADQDIEARPVLTSDAVGETLAAQDKADFTDAAPVESGSLPVPWFLIGTLVAVSAVVILVLKRQAAV